MNIRCNNCGKLGHTFKNCKYPITSYGVILYRFVNDKPKILMIQRKDSLCYTDFLRGKYNINKFMDYLDGVARKLEPRIYDEENPYDREDGEMSDFNGELNLMNIAAEYINSLDYEEDLKDRLKLSVPELYKTTLSPNYED